MEPDCIRMNGMTFKKQPEDSHHLVTQERYIKNKLEKFNAMGVRFSNLSQFPPLNFIVISVQNSAWVLLPIKDNLENPKKMFTSPKPSHNIPRSLKTRSIKGSAGEPSKNYSYAELVSPKFAMSLDLASIICVQNARPLIESQNDSFKKPTFLNFYKKLYTYIVSRTLKI